MSVDHFDYLEDPEEDPEFKTPHEELVSNPADEGLFGSYGSYLTSWFSTSMSASTSPTNENKSDNNILENRTVSYDESILDTLPVIQLKNRKDASRKVLTLPMAESLRQYIPKAFEISGNWKMLYSLDQDGASLNTMYRFMDPYNTEQMKLGFVLIVKDTSDSVFGVFFTNPLSIQPHYYGTGESFLFWVDSKKSCHIYKSTGKNDYYILTKPDLLAFGGGGNGFGLSFSDRFETCMSAKCDTFNNLPYFTLI